MKLLSFSSGYSPCGIADYNRHLVPALTKLAECDTVQYPTERASRDQIGRLLSLRRKFTELAARSANYDAVLVHWVTRFWNGGRAVENMFPAFLNRMECPVVMVLHEWPTIPAAHNYRGSIPMRLAKRAVATAWLATDLRQRDYVRWIERDMFHRMAKIVVHTSQLQDRLLAADVEPRAISVQRFPLHTLPSPSWSPDEVRERFGLRDRRALLLLGLPATRKGFDLAVRALASLPSDVVLLMVCPQREENDRKQVSELKALAAEHGVADRLITSDYLDDAQLAAVFGVVELALSPFRSVTGSSSIAHFLAAGVPVVASDLPPIREMVRSGAGIELFASEDVESLQSVVTAILAAPARLEQMRVRSRDYGAQTSFDALAASVHRLVDEAISERR